MKNNSVKEKNLNQYDQNIAMILNVIDALVYVADMDTHEMIFMNQYGIDHWGAINGKLCWQVLQSNQTGPCDFCTNNKLIDKNGEPTGVYVWEFQNTVNERWYQCRDQAIPWTDGRIVRVEIAADITDRVNTENKLKTAKEEAENLARTDGLTGIRNRRAFFEDSQNIFNLAKRYNHSTSVIMLDIDHFKKINDKYGHSTGDDILISFVETISDNIREVDIFGRIGGEEFAIVLPETSLEKAIKIAEKLRLKISHMQLDKIAHELVVTSSLGVTSTNEANHSFDQILKFADKALYIAKNKGRNCVESYSEHEAVNG